MVVDRSQLNELHNDVLNAWREAVAASKRLPVADRVVIALQLQKRATTLANNERLAGASELVVEADDFATGVKNQSPLAKVVTGYAAVAAVLGFLGLTVFGVLKDAWAPASDAIGVGADATGSALSGLVSLAMSSGLLYAVTQGIAHLLRSAAAALEDLTARQHPAAALLADVRMKEERLFALFDSQVPSVPISTAPVVMVGIAGLALGVVIAFLAGVGVAIR